MLQRLSGIFSGIKSSHFLISSANVIPKDDRKKNGLNNFVKNISSSRRLTSFLAL